MAETSGGGRGLPWHRPRPRRGGSACHAKRASRRRSRAGLRPAIGQKASANSREPLHAGRERLRQASPHPLQCADVPIVAARRGAGKSLPPTSARRRSPAAPAAAGARPPLLAAGDEPPPLYRTQLPPSVTLHYQVRRGSLRGTGKIRWATAGDRYRLALEAQVAGLTAADADERRRHRRPRPGAGALPRPAGAPIGAGGELSPRRRPHHVLRERASSGRSSPAARTASAG